jgi:thymidine kinase
MEYVEGKKGWVECIVGPMFAGKTEELMRRVKRMEYAHKKYLIFKPSIDTRYSISEIVSHNKKSLTAISISHGSDIRRHLKKDTQAIVIDEVQFFDESLIKYLLEYASMGIRVICGGLDRDFRGLAFKVTGEIMAISDSVTKLTAICSCCGKEATMTQRIIDGEPAHFNDPTILVGEMESYEARCRDCHKVIYEDQ